MSGVEIGFVTNCLGQTTIDDALAVARDVGLTCLEIGPSVKRDLPALRRAASAGDVRLHSLIYARNFLTDNPELSAEYQREMRRLLDLAILLDIPQITMSTGVLPQHDLQGNINAALDFWQPFFEEGAQANVRFALEFCPNSGNFALGPATWRPLFVATHAHPNFGLNYDPSHLIWQMIDPYAPIAEFMPRIFSVHAKDTHIKRDVLAEHGIVTSYKYEQIAPHGRVESRAPWWEFRIPGEGDLDWSRFLKEIITHGFEGAIIIELESDAYTGTRAQVIDGLERSLTHLKDSLPVGTPTASIASGE
ncbi:MAG: sugar phosphate isomerase/epimerase [Aggregatilineales bacterium]